MPDETVLITAMEPSDWPAVRSIFEQGIATGEATFETAAPSWDDWDRAHLAEPRLVAGESRVIGWAALTPVSPRAVYRGVAELSIYVDEATRGQGVGRALLAALIEASESAGIWTLQAGMFPENAASMALHLACRFLVMGTHQRLGCMGYRWRDVVLLERRSPNVG